MDRSLTRLLIGGVNTMNIMDYYIDDLSLEGYNLDTVHDIKKNPKLNQILDKLKVAKDRVKDGQKQFKRADYSTAKKSFQSALSLYTEIVRLTNDYKTDVYRMGEPENILQRLLSYFTPLFMWKFPETKLDSVSPTFGFDTDGNTTVGAQLNYVSYEDDMSKTTKSRVKNSFQQRMNLFLQNCNDQIVKLKANITQCDVKLGER